MVRGASSEGFPGAFYAEADRGDKFRIKYLSVFSEISRSLVFVRKVMSYSTAPVNSVI